MTDPYRPDDAPWASPGYSAPGPPPAPGQVPPDPSQVPPHPAVAGPPNPLPPPGGFTLPELPRQPLEPLAIASVVASPLSPVGLGLGIVAWRRLRTNGRRGGALAVTGIVLSSLFLAAAVLVIATFALDGTFARLTETPVAGDVETPRTASPVNLDVGNCVLTLPVTGQVGEVSLTPCSSDHHLQVIDRIGLDGEEYPGSEALFARAGADCRATFDGLASTHSWPSGLTPWHLVPSEANWADGDRNIICFARSTAGPITINLLGS